MKKFLSVFIALAMVLSLFAGVGARTAKAAGAATVTVGTATMAAGGSAVIDVTATIPAGQNIAAMQFSLTYDATKVSIPSAEVTAGALTSTFMANNPTATTLNVGGLWATVGAGAPDPTVILAHVTVHALAGLTPGSSTVITLSVTTLADSSIASYAVTPVNGTVHVVSIPATVTVGSATLAPLGSAVIDVTAAIPAGHNVATMQFSLTYDATKISIPSAEVTAGALTSTFMANNPNAATLSVGGLASDLVHGVAGPTVILAHVTVHALAGLTAGTSTPITLSVDTLVDSSLASYAVTPVNGTVHVVSVPATVTVGSATLAPLGSAVIDVTAAIPAGHNVAVMGFTLTYDDTKISIPAAGVTPGALTSTFMANNPTATTLNVGGLWATVGAGAPGPTVILAHVTVHALAGLTAGTSTPVTLTVDTLADSSIASYAVTPVNGTVHVVSIPATVTVGSATLAPLGSAVIDVTATIPAGHNVGTMGFMLSYDATKVSIPSAEVTAGALTSTFVKNNPSASTLIVGGLAVDLVNGASGPTVILAHVTVHALAGLTPGTSTPITVSAVTLADSTAGSYAVTLVDGLANVLAITPGDVDGNGTVTMLDALLAARAYVGLVTLSPGSQPFLAADVNHDGYITMLDVLLIARIYVGL